jgi:hypothetical protein
MLSNFPGDFSLDDGLFENMFLSFHVFSIFSDIFKLMTFNVIFF